MEDTSSQNKIGLIALWTFPVSSFRTKQAELVAVRFAKGE